MGFILLYLFFFLPVLLSYILFKKQRGKPHQRANLPPGSMGWPYIGETLQLYSQNPNVFFTTRQNRYGEIFKTHILGCPCVMLVSPEAARFVLVTQAHLFKPTYPMSKETLIGPSALFFHQGGYHTKMRKLVQGSLSLDVIRNLVPDIEAAAISALESWSGGQVVNTFHGMKKFTFDVAIMSIFGQLDTCYKEKLKKKYYTLDKGYNSLPTNLPGTLYRRSVLARGRLSQILSEIISERKEKRLVQKDLLGCLLSFKYENGQILTDDQIADNIIGVLFAAQDTTASLLTWVLKYIHDDPKLLEAIKVILESLRMASIISFIYREAVDDVEYKGYLIPKGWKVLPLFRNIHHNLDFFTDPQKFDPSRFEVGLKPNTFMPFGNGVHACPGNEIAKLEMLILVHHLVNKFRWEVVGANSGVQYDPFPVPQQGLPAKFWKESCSQGQHGCP